MKQQPGMRQPGMTPAAQARLAGDWATILQSEQAALAVDREVQEAMLRMAAGLAQQAATLHGRTADAAPGPAEADAAPRPPAVDDAPAAIAARLDADSLDAAPPDAARPDADPFDDARSRAGLG